MHASREASDEPFILQQLHFHTSKPIKGTPAYLVMIRRVHLPWIGFGSQYP